MNQRHRKACFLVLGFIVLLCVVALAGGFYLTQHGLVLIFDWINLVIEGILCFALFLLISLTVKKTYRMTSAFVLSGIFIFFLIQYQGSVPTQTLFSAGPSFEHFLIIKRDDESGEAHVYRQRFLWYAKRQEMIPYTVGSETKLQWLSKDICAFTYRSPDNKLHQYVATFGVRDDGISYSLMVNALQGEWVMMDRNSSGWQFEVNDGGFIVRNGYHEERFSYEDCVQFGTIALVLCKKGLPQYTLTLDQNTTLNADDRVSYGGTMSITAVSLEKTAPIQFTMITPEPEEIPYSDPLDGKATVLDMLQNLQEDKNRYPTIEASDDYKSLAYAALVDDYQALAVNGVDVEIQVLFMTLLAGTLDDFLVELEYESTAASFDSSETMVLRYRYRIMRKQDTYIYYSFNANVSCMEGLAPLSMPATEDVSSQES